MRHIAFLMEDPVIVLVFHKTLCSAVSVMPNEMRPGRSAVILAVFHRSAHVGRMQHGPFGIRGFVEPVIGLVHGHSGLCKCGRSGDSEEQNRKAENVSVFSHEDWGGRRANDAQGDAGSGQHHAMHVPKGSCPAQGNAMRGSAWEKGGKKKNLKRDLRDDASRTKELPQEKFQGTWFGESLGTRIALRWKIEGRDGGGARWSCGCRCACRSGRKGLTTIEKGRFSAILSEYTKSSETNALGTQLDFPSRFVVESDQLVRKSIGIIAMILRA